jgi:3-deoxy-D-manno-octulosonate 8-phosphate phosphatase (KDO 8-P phosphatase)
VKLNDMEKVVLKLFIMDVDGVLTDAGMYYSQNGDELKRFSTYDGKAMEILHDKGVKTAIITAENTKIVERRANKIKVDFLFQGVEDKLALAKELCIKEHISLENEVSYIGDDINDLGLLNFVKYKACPVNAMMKVKEIDGIELLCKKGGDGAVREFVELLLSEGCLGGS